MSGSELWDQGESAYACLHTYTITAVNYLHGWKL